MVLPYRCCKLDWWNLDTCPGLFSIPFLEKMEHYFSQTTCLCGGDHTDLADDVLSGFESVHFCCFFQHFLFCFSEICLRETWFNSLKSQQILFGKAILLQSHVLRIFSPMQFSILFHFMWEKNLDTTQNKPGHLKIRIFHRWESEFRRNCVFIFHITNSEQLNTKMRN